MSLIPRYMNLMYHNGNHHRQMFEGRILLLLTVLLYWSRHELETLVYGPLSRKFTPNVMRPQKLAGLTFFDKKTILEYSSTLIMFNFHCVKKFGNQLSQ